jgi:hypothetical protein
MMAFTKSKILLVISMFFLSLFSRAQNVSNQIDSLIPNRKMENKIVIGKVIIPKNSIEEFRKQNVTSGFLKTLKGYVKGEIYEMIDATGNLNMITVTTWLNQESYSNAQVSLAEYYKTIKFDPKAFRERLGIVAEHGLYSIKE